MVGQQPPDHFLLAGRQVNLRGGQLGMTQDKLDVGYLQPQLECL
jgi:hypothetical protein